MSRSSLSADDLLSVSEDEVSKSVTMGHSKSMEESQSNTGTIKRVKRNKSGENIKIPKPPPVTRIKKLTNKSISTDGSEGRALPEPNENKENQVVKETVDSCLNSLTIEEEEPMAKVADIDMHRRHSLVKKTDGELIEGRFQIGDLHERYKTIEEKESEDLKIARLRRSKSTGELLGKVKKKLNLPCKDSTERTKDIKSILESKETDLGRLPEVKPQEVKKHVMFKTDNISPGRSKSLASTTDAAAQKAAQSKRSRFKRQKSFELDSDSTDIEDFLKESKGKKRDEEINDKAVDLSSTPESGLSGDGKIEEPLKASGKENRMRFMVCEIKAIHLKGF